MNHTHAPQPSGNPQRYSAMDNAALGSHSDSVKRVLRNTYALLAMTLLFSAGVAVVTLTLQLPAPGLAVSAMVALLSAGLILFGFGGSNE
jgi:modulator of FtsH protease